MRRLSSLFAAVAVLISVATASASEGAHRAKEPKSYWLRTVSLTGTHMRQLFRSPIVNDEYSPRQFIDLSPNRKRALMVKVIPKDVDHADEILYVADLHGRGGHEVARASDSTVTGRWSPDGARFYYYTFNNREPGCSDFTFWSARPDGTGSEPLGSGLEFHWGPGHDSFAILEGCVAGNGPHRLVYTDRAGARHVITNQPAFGGFTVSPRGDRIAYTTYGADSSQDLHIARTDGGGDIASIRDVMPTWVDWSPDGTRIAFIRPWRSGQFTGSLALANADGTHVRIVVPWGRDKKGLAVYSARRPSWSPNGRRLAYFSGGLNGVNALETIRPDGRGNRVVVRGDLSNLWWAPDSRHLYYDGVG
jgi:Tol biopolymer transport system component